MPTEDHRGETAYDVSNGQQVVIDYIGVIRDGFTPDAPITPFDEWADGKWLTDAEAQYAFDVEAAGSRKDLLITEANAYMNNKQ